MKKKKIVLLASCAAFAISAAGCGAKEHTVAVPVTEIVVETAETTALAETAVEAEMVIIEEKAVPLYSKPAGSNVRVPQASGTVRYDNGDVSIDASNISQGYLMVKYSGGSSKIKVQVSKSGGETYTYDLNARSAYEVFPLTESSGSYTVKVLEQVTGNQYSLKSSQNLSVALGDEFSPFLYPNQYVNFSADSQTVKKGTELAASATDAVGVINNVYNFVVDNFTYDTPKANSVQSGYLPNVDQVLAQQKGICFDYAAVMTSMLRSQNIPTKLIVGYTGSLYHAWINVYIEGQGWVNNNIYFDGQQWKMMDPTFASSGKNDASVQEYILNSANYKQKYSY